MNRLYHIARYIKDRCLYDATGRQAISVEKVIKLFLQYLDENNVVYGEGEFHTVAKDGKGIIDEPV